MKNNKGITLIALVVTIVVLLILAGISISVLVGENGIIRQAQTAKKETEQARVEELVKIAVNSLIGKNLGDKNKITSEDIAKEINKMEKREDVYAEGNKIIFPKEKMEVEVDFKGIPELPESEVKPGEIVKETKKDNYIDENGDKATIPEGFTVSGIEEEQKIANGLVIYYIPEEEEVDWTKQEVQTKYNQYVWIPSTIEEYKRTEWRVEEDNGSKAARDEVTLKEITELSEYDISNGLTIEILKEISNQIEMEKLSIEKYEGFYIGRYENGEENVITKYQTPYADIKWVEAYIQAKNIDVGNGAVSYLSSSYSRDTALNFIQNNSVFKEYASTRDDGINGTLINENWRDKEVKYIDEQGNEQIKAADTELRLPTGVTTAKCNIYDFGGNVVEYTTELNPLVNGDNNASVILRGGSYLGTAIWRTSPAGSRADGETKAITGLGFRASLFIK